MYNLSDNTEFMICDETDETIEEPYESLLQRYQEKLEKKMKGSEFVLDIVNLLHYKYHKISLNRAESYVHCFKGLKN